MNDNANNDKLNKLKNRHVKIHFQISMKHKVSLFASSKLIASLNTYQVTEGQIGCRGTLGQ